MGFVQKSVPAAQLGAAIAPWLDGDLSGQRRKSVRFRKKH